MMQDPRRRPTTEVRHRERVQNQVGLHAILHRPANHGTIEQVDDDRQVEPALGRRQVRDVGCPGLVRSGRLETSTQKILGDRQRMLGIRSGLETPLMAGTDTVLTHQALHARLARAEAPVADLVMDPGTSVGALGLAMDSLDQR